MARPFGVSFRIQRWKNVKATTVVDVEKLGQPAKELLTAFRDPEAPEDDQLELTFESSGYRDPGITSGPPERCYPPESEDERILDLAEVNGHKILDDAVLQILDADPVVRAAIEEAELPEDSDEPDWDVIREAREERRRDP